MKLCVVVVFVVGMLLSISATARDAMTPEQRLSLAGPLFEPTMTRVVAYPDEMYAVPYSCYRIGRCSANELYYFADRPNNLTRLAPAVPGESAELRPSIYYEWLFVPITPRENILPKYRAASLVRDEYRAVGTPIHRPN